MRRHKFKKDYAQVLVYRYKVPSYSATLKQSFTYRDINTCQATEAEAFSMAV